MTRIGKKLRSAVLVLAVTAIAGISVSANDFGGRTVREGGIVTPAVLPAANSGVVATTVQFRRPLGYYDRWGHFHYYPWAYSGRVWNDYRFRRGDWDDHYRFRRDWDDHHRRDFDRRFDRR